MPILLWPIYTIPLIYLNVTLEALPDMPWVSCPSIRADATLKTLAPKRQRTCLYRQNSPPTPGHMKRERICTATLGKPCLLHLPFGINVFFLRISIIFALYADCPCLSSLRIIVDNECCQFSTSDAASIKTLGVIVDLKTLARIVTIDDSGPLISRNEVLIFIPQLGKKLC